MGIIPKLGGIDKYLSLIHVRDLARAVIMSMDKAKTKRKTYFVANEKPYAWKEIANATLRVLGKKGIHISVPITIMKVISVVSEGVSSFTKKPALINSQKILEMEPNFWTCSSDKAFKDFGFRSELDLDEGVADTIAWYKEHKWM